MDLYTAYPHTVEPLPFHAMSRYPYGTDEQYPGQRNNPPVPPPIQHTARPAFRPPVRRAASAGNSW